MEIAPITRIVGLCTPACSPLGPLKIGLEIIQFLQQHEDVFAARGEICSDLQRVWRPAAGAERAGQGSGRTSKCASLPAARATAAAGPARPGIRAQAPRLSADRFGRALSPSAPCHSIEGAQRPPLATGLIRDRNNVAHPSASLCEADLVAAAVQHDLHKPAQLRREVLLWHREAPVAIFNGVDEPIWSRSGGRNLLQADAHQQMPDLRPFRIGVEIQLPDLGGAGKATGAAYGDGRGLVERPASSGQRLG